MYKKTTHHVEVEVLPNYLSEHSRPEEDFYVWSYTIQIYNFGPRPVQLLARSWKIVDSQGNNQEVRGAGVVGKQPILFADESFEYTSNTTLPTPSGLMYGNYHLIYLDHAEHFSIEIPTFSLDSPYEIPVYN